MLGNSMLDHCFKNDINGVRLLAVCFKNDINVVNYKEGYRIIYVIYANLCTVVHHWFPYSI